MKGVLEDDHIPINKFRLLVLGTIAPIFTVISASGVEEELETEELPDRTVVSMGRTGPIEFTITIPMHHRLEQSAMELWYTESRDPILPTYKKPAVLTHYSISGESTTSFVFVDMFPFKRGLPSLEMGAEGELAVVTWHLKASVIIPLILV